MHQPNELVSADSNPATPTPSLWRRSLSGKALAYRGAPGAQSWFETLKGEAESKRTQVRYLSSLLKHRGESHECRDDELC